MLIVNRTLLSLPMTDPASDEGYKGNQKEKDLMSVLLILPSSGQGHVVFFKGSKKSNSND